MQKAPRPPTVALQTFKQRVLYLRGEHFGVHSLLRTIHMNAQLKKILHNSSGLSLQRDVQDSCKQVQQQQEQEQEQEQVQ